MLTIFLIEDKENTSRQAADLIREAGYEYVPCNWNSRLTVLSDIEINRPDIVLFCASIKEDTFGVTEFLREIRIVSPSSQILVVSENHSVRVCDIAIDGEADWVLSLEEAEQLLEKVLHRMERKKQKISKNHAEMKQYLFAAFVKEKNRLSRDEYRELFGNYEKEPLFQIVIVHVLPPYRKRNLLDENNIATMKGSSILEEHLKRVDKYLLAKDRLDIIICLIGSGEELQNARLQLNQYLRDMQEMNVTLTRAAAWVSLGKTVERTEDIPDSYASACALLNARFFGESISLLEAKTEDGTTKESEFKEQFWIYDVRKTLANALEILDERVIHRTLMQLKSNLVSAVNFQAEDVYVIYKTLVSVFLKELESREIDLSEHFIHYDSLLREYDFFWNLDDLFGNLERLYLEGIRILKEKEENSAPSAIVQAKSYIRAYFNMPLTLKEVSDYVGMNEHYFSDYFSKYMKMTFKQYLTELRIRYSKQLLLDRRYSMEDIAEAIGYNDVKYFFRVFKRVTGITPKEYRTKYYVKGV
ncbi:MAG: helix-turn-helix transcriptional regulator [Eubacteriales bacterium]|nr:helix-turn-helix transcriptional regulator [Eubacteriales bacterium]